MLPIALDTYISAPREQIFDYVADLANRIAWTDHFQAEFHLTRIRTSRPGSSARYRTDPPFITVLYTETAITELDRPRRIVEQGGQGKLNRTRVQVVWDFTQEGPTQTRVAVELRTDPGRLLDRMGESFGARGYYRRQYATALERLRMIFEEPRDGELARASVAAYEPLKAPRYI